MKPLKDECDFCKAKRGERHPQKGFVVSLKAVNVNGLIKKGCQICYRINFNKWK